MLFRLIHSLLRRTDIWSGWVFLQNVENVARFKIVFCLQTPDTRRHSENLQNKQ